MYLFFFWIFCFLTFSRIFQEVKKVKIFMFFSYKWNLRNVFELIKIFDMKSWSALIKFFIGASYRLLLRQKIFFIFLKFMSMFWTNLKKKKLKIWKKIPKMFNFWNFICGSAAEISAENSIKNILLPKIITKTIWSKIRPLHHHNIQKVEPPPRNGHF